jgi:sigma-B regulation protein RsbU (phosphoserine phosphatase)
MAVTKTLMKSRAMDDLSTASILTHVNDELSRENESSMFVTVFLAILDITTGTLTYTNAGHNPPYIRRADGELARLDNRHGPVVAAMEGITYSETKDRLNEGDLILLYTDGVTEAMNPTRELFGEEQLRDVLGEVPGYSAEKMVQRLERLLELRLKNELPEIDNANRQVSEFIEALGIETKFRRQLNIVLDELLNNIISYAYEDDEEHDIQVTVELTGQRLVVSIMDDGIPFNAFSQEAPDTEAGLEDRAIGGLGIHLVRNLMDEVNYQRGIGRNIVTLVKQLEESAS